MTDSLVQELRNPPPIDENIWRSLMKRAADEIEQLRSIAGPIIFSPTLSELKRQKIVRSGDVTEIYIQKSG